MLFTVCSHCQTLHGYNQWPGDCNASFTLKYQHSFATSFNVLLPTSTFIIRRINTMEHLFLNFHEWKIYSLAEKVGWKTDHFDGFVNVHLFPHPEYFTNKSI